MAVRKGFTFLIEDREYKEYSPKKAGQLQFIIPWPNIHRVTLRRDELGNRYLVIYFKDDTPPKTFDVEHFSKDILTGDLKDIAEMKDFAFTIREIGDPKAVDPLIKALKDGKRDAQQAAESLGKIGDPKAVDPLIKALEDGNKEIRGIAAKALGEIGDPKAVDPLIKALEDENWAVRLFVVRALGKIGDQKAIEPLVGTLEDEEFLVGEAAAESLFGMGVSEYF